MSNVNKKDEKIEEEITMKVILIGNSGVGKTNLINTCIGLNFDEGTNPSTSGSFVQKKINIGYKQYILNIWDTAGQETYKSITKIFIKNSELVIYVYDITDIKSFNDLEDWIKMTVEMIGNDYIGAIVGNKDDLYLNSQVNEEEARKYAESKGMKFQLVSAKTNPGLFTEFLKEIIQGNEGLLSQNDTLKGNISLKSDNYAEKSCQC